MNETQARIVSYLTFSTSAYFFDAGDVQSCVSAGWVRWIDEGFTASATEAGRRALRLVRLKDYHLTSAPPPPPDPPSSNKSLT